MGMTTDFLKLLSFPVSAEGGLSAKTMRFTSNMKTAGSGDITSSDSKVETISRSWQGWNSQDTRF